MNLVFRNPQGREIPRNVELIPRGDQLEIVDVEYNVALAMVGPEDFIALHEGKALPHGDGTMRLMLN
jgi:hypothetical protein